MTQGHVSELNTLVQSKLPLITNAFEEVSKKIVGQRYLIERLFMGLMVGGHVLVEGVPGLAKTTTVNALADACGIHFKRIQFTPDLLPADILGTQVYSPKDHEFYVKKGPLFSNLILADEINRAPAKVQSALLEAMQEKQITIGEDTFKLDKPFVVMATQNPIEQEGTYPLPEAQVDRFMLKLKIDYPSIEEEKEIIKRVNASSTAEIKSILTTKDLLDLGSLVKKIYVDPKIDDYIVNLIFATRTPEKINKDLENAIEFGASPRASINLNIASRAKALLEGRGFVIPEDVKAIAHDVLRHRILMSYEAEAEGIDSDQVIDTLLNSIDVP